MHNLDVLCSSHSRAFHQSRHTLMRLVLLETSQVGVKLCWKECEPATLQMQVQLAPAIHMFLIPLVLSFSPGQIKNFFPNSDSEFRLASYFVLGGRRLRTTRSFGTHRCSVVRCPRRANKTMGLLKLLMFFCCGDVKTFKHKCAVVDQMVRGTRRTNRRIDASVKVNVEAAQPNDNKHVAYCNCTLVIVSINMYFLCVQTKRILHFFTRPFSL